MFKNKIVLITGASRGIGAAILKMFAQAHATVIGTATSETGAANITAAIKEYGAQGKGYVLDIANSESIAAFVEQVAKEFQYPDILINNAGITKDNLLLRMRDNEWDDVLKTDLTGVFQLTKLCLKGMLKNRYGRIINLSSVVAFAGNPGQANYCAAKAGLIGFTKSLAHELASRNITVNAVAPGFISTDMTDKVTEQHKEKLLQQIPLQRMGQPEEIAQAVLFLASDAAAYMTGQTLHVNGGMYMA